MATVIDVLIVEFGLDPSQFTKGQKKAVEDIRGLENQVDKSGKNVQHTVNGVRNQVMSMMAAFLAGRGLKEFIKDMVTAEAETARLAHQLDMIPQELATISGAAAMVGGTARFAAAQVQSLVQGFQNFSLTGESATIPYLRALGVGISEVDTGKLKDLSVFYRDLNRAVQGMDPARAAALLRGAGIQDQGTLNMLLLTTKAYDALVAEQKRLGVITREDAEAGLALQHSWLALQQSSTSMGRTLLTDVAGPLAFVMDKLTDLAVWVRGHKPLMQAFFASLAVAAVGLTIAFSPITGTVLAITAAVLAASAAIGLLYDDWKVWTEGGQSALGGLWKYVDRTLKLVVALFTGTGPEIRAAWNNLLDGMGLDASKFGDTVLKALKKGVQAWAETVGKGLNWMQGRINAFWNAITGHDLFAQHDFTGGGGKKEEKPKPAPAGKAPGPTGKKPAKEEVWAAAKASEAKYGIPAEVTVAQFALESANGTHMPAGSNNPFGIKAKAGQDYVEASTREFIHGQMVTVKQKFAKFGSLAEAFDEHAKLLATSKHYGKARETSNADDFADALTGVYATDPNYGTKLKTIMADMKAPQVNVAAGKPAAAPQVNVASAALVGIPLSIPKIVPGAKQMAMADASKGGNTTNHTTSHQTKIEKVIVQTQAKDAPGIARDIGPAIARDTFATQAQSAAA